MKQNQNLIAKGAQSITSLEIAQVTGKTHAHVLRDIRNMEPAWEQEHGAKFGFMQQREELPNGGYRLRPVFVLSKIESLYIATKFNDVARAKLVLRWEELEKRRSEWKPRDPKVTTGYLARYASMVTSGNRGAILEIPR